MGTGGSGNGRKWERAKEIEEQSHTRVPSARTVSTAITVGVADGSPSFMAELDDFETERGEVLHDQVKARRRPRRAGAGLRGPGRRSGSHTPAPGFHLVGSARRAVRAVF